MLIENWICKNCDHDITGEKSPDLSYTVHKHELENEGHKMVLQDTIGVFNSE